MPTIKGTASVSDSRAREKALKKTKFPKSFGLSVSLEKVNKPVLTQWIEQKVASILGFDDDIVSSTAINLFLPSNDSIPDPKKAQLDLTGFLGEDAVTFSSELWDLMLEAQASSCGIPKTLLEQKKKEMTERANQNKQLHQRRSSSQYQIPNRNNNTACAGRSPESSQSANKERNDRKDRTESGSNGENEDQFGRVVLSEESRKNKKCPAEQKSSRCRASRSRSRSRDRNEDYKGKEDSRCDGRRFDNSSRLVHEDRRRHDYYNDRSRFHNRRYHDGYHNNRDHDRDRFRNDRDWNSRFHNDDLEMEDLEHRLVQLMKYSGSKRSIRSIRKIDEEIHDIQYRIYELEQRRRGRHSSSHDYRSSWSHRNRSPRFGNRRSAKHRSRIMQVSEDDLSREEDDSDGGSQQSSPTTSPEPVEGSN